MSLAINPSISVCSLHGRYGNAGAPSPACGSAYGVDQERDARLARDAILADRAIRLARWQAAGIRAGKEFRYVFRYFGLAAIITTAVMGFGAGMFITHGDPLRGLLMAAIFIVVFGLPVALAGSSLAWLIARLP